MNQQPRSNWFGRNWLWAVPVGCLTPVVACGGFIALILTVVFGAIKSSDPYQQSLARVTADRRVVTALGTPVEPALIVLGNININGSSGNADISYGVSGPKGFGTVYVVATKAAGVWTWMIWYLFGAFGKCR